MTDTTKPLTMPPGFRWCAYEPWGTAGDLTHLDTVVPLAKYCTKPDAVRFSNAIVGPAVEVATAELRAQVAVLEKRLTNIATQAGKAAEGYQNIINGNPPGVERDAESVADCAVEDFEGLARLARGGK